MAGNNTANNRWALPDNWNVTATICVIVPIPDDAEYIGMFRGLLDTLTWQRSFEKHPTEDAAYQVSKTWQNALASRELEFQFCEGPTMLRQNPANVCQMQQSQDGGDTWTLAFDYSLCAQAITVPAPYHGSDTGASDAAAQAIRVLQIGVLQISDDICALTRAEYIDAALAYVRRYEPSFGNPAALGQIYDAWCAASPDEQAAHLADCVYQDHRDDLQDCAGPDGLFDWLNCTGSAINNWLNETGDSIMSSLNTLASLLSGNAWQNASAGGAGGGAGFDDGCNWRVRFGGGNTWGDAGEWTLSGRTPLPIGAYNAGSDSYDPTEWYFTGVGPGNKGSGIYLEAVPTASFHLTEARLTVLRVGDASTCFMAIDGGPSWDAGDMPEGVETILAATGDWDLDLIHIASNMGNGDSAPPEGIYLLKMTLAGTGTRPDFGI